MARAQSERAGEVFGRLTVLMDSGDRTKSGDVKWLCSCSCGNETSVSYANLKHGKTKSCGCMAREMSSERATRLFKKDKKECSFDGCVNDTSKGGKGYCGMHYARLKRYGDTSYVTPEEQRRASARKSAMKGRSAGPDTYKKLYGRHEHRVIAEKILGRKLRSDEHVHHIDMNKHNNDPSNLAVMDGEDHLKLHADLKSKGTTDAQFTRLSAAHD